MLHVKGVMCTSLLWDPIGLFRRNLLCRRWLREKWEKSMAGNIGHCVRYCSFSFFFHFFSWKNIKSRYFLVLFIDTLIWVSLLKISWKNLKKWPFYANIVKTYIYIKLLDFWRKKSLKKKTFLSWLVNKDCVYQFWRL